jgi:hypothetical protein
VDGFAENLAVIPRSCFQNHQSLASHLRARAGPASVQTAGSKLPGVEADQGRLTPPHPGAGRATICRTGTAPAPILSEQLTVSKNVIRSGCVFIPALVLDVATRRVFCFPKDEKNR